MKTWINSFGETVIDDGVTLHVVTNADAAKLSTQVARVLSEPGNENVVAVVDDDLGVVAAFMAPVNPYAINETKLAEVRAAVKEAEDRLRHAEAADRPWAERKRLEAELAHAKAQLDAGEHGLALERGRQQAGS